MSLIDEQPSSGSKRECINQQFEHQWCLQWFRTEGNRDCPNFISKFILHLLMSDPILVDTATVDKCAADWEMDPLEGLVEKRL